MQKLPVQVQILDQRIGSLFELPQYGTDASAGMDLRACLEQATTLNPGESLLVPTGIAIYIENPQWVGLIMPRSGLGHKHGLVLGNLTGVIDADYQGPLMVSLWNREKTPFTIHPGDRIAQLLFIPVVQAQLNVVRHFNRTQRGEGGFGSTGVS